MSPDPHPNRSKVVVAGGSPEAISHLASRLRTIFGSLDPSVVVSEESGVSSDDGARHETLTIKLMSPNDSYMSFIGDRSDYQLQLIALAIRARQASPWFDQIVKRSSNDPIPLLQRPGDSSPESNLRSDYVTGYLLSQFDKLADSESIAGAHLELLDILRPAWIEGGRTSVVFVTTSKPSMNELRLIIGTVDDEGEWTWGQSISISRNTNIHISVHEVDAPDIPMDRRRFATLSNLADQGVSSVQLLFDSQDFEQLINYINQFRRTDTSPEDSTVPASEALLSPEEALAEALAELDSLVGLTEVKKAVADFTNLMRVNRQRQLAGQQFGEISTHFVFTGSPGTGKTTVARLIAKILYGLNMLPTYGLHEVLRSDLVAGYVGQTAIKTKETIATALGGVLFIDEAYSLSDRDRDDFGAEAIETLLAEMENNRDNLCVIVAGYQDKMDSFLSSNPGLRSRFSRTFYFPDYSSDELAEIFRRIVRSKGLFLRDGVIDEVDSIFTEARAQAQFGNARAVRQFVEDTLVRQANRIAGSLSSMSADELQTITIEDVSPLDGSNHQMLIDEAGLAQSLSELDALVGLLEVKKRLKSFVDVARMQIQRRQMGLPTHHVSTTFAFVGPSGTGKTTVARLVGKILLDLGILRRGHTIEVSRSDLVAGFVGQTAIKTREQVGRAIDGVLFIDEAYSLVPEFANSTDFGIEAVQELLTQMENNRHRLSLILAGYNDEMETFLNSNPGLRSRIGEILQFASYSPDDLSAIFLSFAEKAGYRVPSDLRADLKAFFTTVLQDENSGQARAARMLLDDAIRIQAHRLSGHTGPSRSDLESLSIDDVREAMGLNPIDLAESDTQPLQRPVSRGNPTISTHETMVTPSSRTFDSPFARTDESQVTEGFREVDPSLSTGRTVVVDGSNVAMEGGRALLGERVCSLRLLREAKESLKQMFGTENVIVVVDATFRHRVHQSERDDANAALNAHEFAQPPAGAIGRGDGLILSIADSTNAIVVSNDSFNKPGEPFLTRYPWLLDPDRVIGHNYVLGAGWIFTSRQLR